MELTGHLCRHRLRLTGVAIAVALCAALVAAAPASALRPAEYQAPLKRASGPNGYITFKVKSRKAKQSKKSHPVLIKKFGLFTVTQCDDGEGQEADYYPSLAPWPIKIPVSGGNFSLSDSGGFPVEGGTFTYTINFSGHIPRHGLPSGTLRYRTTGPVFVDDTLPPPGPDERGTGVRGRYVQRSCDTGPMTWTAKRLPPNSL
jgi:hypothetical protein